jgi:hypothetical protein
MSKCNTMEAAQSETVEWQPARLIRRQVQSTNDSDDDGLASSRFALVVLNQPLPANLDVIRRLWDNGVFSSWQQNYPTERNRRNKSKR